MPGAAAMRPPGGFGGAPVRGGETDAMEEVRVRMPMRLLGGAIGADEPYASAVIFPTIRGVVSLAPMLERCRYRGQRVLVDSDADVFSGDGCLITENVKSGRATYAPPHQVKRWRKKYAEMVRAADAVTVAMPLLAKVYRDAGAQRVFVCPNAIDPGQWAPPPLRGDGFSVGFAGGPGHEEDLELIRPALEWAAGRAGCETVLFGAFAQPALDVPAQVPRVWRSSRFVPFTPSYAEYRRRLSGLFDLGLMPLADTVYNRGRSDLKICEYAMAGALPIVSDAPNYDAWRDTPVLFARDADEFLEHVQWGVTHREEARERARAVRDCVLERRTIKQTLPLWREALDNGVI